MEPGSQVPADQRARSRQVVAVRWAAIDEMEGTKRPLPGCIEAIKAHAGLARALVEVANRSDQVEAALHAVDAAR